MSKRQIDALVANCDEFGITLFGLDDPRQGIVHVIGPENGITQPGMTIVCGDSHTATHGAFGALAFGMSGTLTVNLHFYQRINALIWLPGLLWAISAISRQPAGWRRVPAMLGLAACMCMTHTAGGPSSAELKASHRPSGE